MRVLPINSCTELFDSALFPTKLSSSRCCSSAVGEPHAAGHTDSFADFVGITPPAGSQHSFGRTGRFIAIPNGSPTSGVASSFLIGVPGTVQAPGGVGLSLSPHNSPRLSVPLLNSGDADSSLSESQFRTWIHGAPRCRTKRREASSFFMAELMNLLFTDRRDRGPATAGDLYNRYGSQLGWMAAPPGDELEKGSEASKEWVEIVKHSPEIQPGPVAPPLLPEPDVPFSMESCVSTPEGWIPAKTPKGFHCFWGNHDLKPDDFPQHIAPPPPPPTIEQLEVAQQKRTATLPRRIRVLPEAPVTARQWDISEQPGRQW